MRSEKGYTLFEVLIVLGLIGVVSGIAIPVFLSSNAMSAIWTSSERVGATVRQTRFKAISQNATFQLRFDCPAVGQMRALIMTGDPAVDDDPGRCGASQPGDSEVVSMDLGVSFDAAAATALQVTGRGVFSAIGDAIPLTISVTNGSSARYLTVSATGQITFSDTEPVTITEP